MSQDSRQATPTPASKPEFPTMESVFHKNVLSFISNPSPPKWNTFFNLIDQLTVRLTSLSSLQNEIPTPTSIQKQA
jgi:hypothetical protein